MNATAHISDFDKLAECVSLTLKLQAGHEKDRADAASGKSGEFNKILN